MIEKLAEIEKTHEELTQRLADPALLADRKSYAETNKALAEISSVVELYREYKRVQKQCAETDEMLVGLPKDDEFYEIARDERERLTSLLVETEERLRVELMPRDPNDERNVVLEIRAGTGGDEATLFASELFRMYTRYAEQRGWRMEVIDLSESEVGGVHRVQRVPATEAAGRIHTSAVTVAVLPEADDVEVEVDEKDLRIDRFCASGP